MARGQDQQRDRPTCYAFLLLESVVAHRNQKTPAVVVSEEETQSLAAAEGTPEAAPQSSAAETLVAAEEPQTPAAETPAAAGVPQTPAAEAYYC